MKSISDIPFECFDIATLAKLSTLCKNFEGRAKREFITRDIGKELYHHLRASDVFRLSIITQLDHAKKWDIIKCVFKTQNLPSYWNVMCIPSYTSIRLNMQYSYVHPDILMSNTITLDFLKTVPNVFGSSNLISPTLDECVYNIYHTIENIAIATSGVLPEYTNARMDWCTSPVAIYIINLLAQDIYVLEHRIFQRYNAISTVNPYSAIIANTSLSLIVHMLVDAEFNL